MSASAIGESLLQELARRYEPTLVPACRRCGAPLVVVAVGGGSPTRYACSTQSDTTLRVDWNHYEASRWEDPRRGGDEGVMQLITAFRALRDASPTPEAPAEWASSNSSRIGSRASSSKSAAGRSEPLR